MQNEINLKCSEIANKLGVSFDMVDAAFKNATPQLINLATEVKQLNWLFNLRPKEVKNLKIKRWTLGLTFNETRRLNLEE